MHVLIDMNLTPRWVEYLNGVGHDAVHWSSIGRHRRRMRKFATMLAQEDTSS